MRQSGRFKPDTEERDHEDAPAAHRGSHAQGAMVIVLEPTGSPASLGRIALDRMRQLAGADGVAAANAVGSALRGHDCAADDYGERMHRVQRRSVPLAKVREVATRHISPGRTVGLVAKWLRVLDAVDACAEASRDPSSHADERSPVALPRGGVLSRGSRLPLRKTPG